MKMQRYCSLWWRPWWDQLCPCSPCRSMGEKRPTTSPWMPHPGAVYSWGSASCGRDLHRHFMKICSLWEGLTWEKFIEDCLLWEWPYGEAEDKWGEIFFWVRKEQQRWHELTTAPIRCATEERGEREFGSEVEPEKRGSEGKMFLRFSFYFSSSHSDLIGYKFSWFPRIKSGLPMTVDAEQSPCPYVDPWALCFLSTVQLKSEMINGFGGHLISSQGHPTTLLYLRAAPSARLWPLRTNISFSMLSPRTVLEQAFFA